MPHTKPAVEVKIEPGWRKPAGQASLSEVHRSVVIPTTASFWRKLFAFSGPGFLIAVGYMDPGNWATDLAGGAQFGYTLLSVVMISNLMAILLQHLSIKLGVATGRDLAQACRDHYSTPVVWFLWILSEIAIGACDLAEVVGSAIALQLLFGIPLVWGCVITAVDVIAVLFLQTRGFRYVEALVITLIATIATCFSVELFLSKPHVGPMLLGFIPSPEILKNQNMLYVAIGIIGATVMPHNLYLHSSIVQTRKFEQNPEGKREAIKFATIDSTVALMFALLVNGAILALAAAAFHWSGHQDVAEIQDAYKLLSPLLGVSGAGILFAVALLASGQNSTLTGTLAGQVVMEGFVNIRLRPWLRRLITRLIAIVPAVCVIGFFGESKTTELLVASQVVLSMQLGFAVWPLIQFTSEKAKMDGLANPLWLKILGWTTAAIIIILNMKLLFDTFMPNSVLKPFYGFFGLPGPG
ncbi:MAG: Nramp family divalent metal transporter [Methylacidiphilales bacterium]|nr:Nramp family divalent metal transporter [Candidatus Methylacidiphilales bacterium]